MLRTKPAILSAFAGLWLLAAACGGETVTDAPKAEADHVAEAVAVPDTGAVQPINPNGDSEMGLLMRGMHEHLKAIRKQLKEGEEVDLKLADYLKNIHEAQLTDESIRGPVLESFANMFVAKAEALEQASMESRVEAFNGMVDACMECHINFCPGPVSTINKLHIK